jgi:hypothetical protein
MAPVELFSERQSMKKYLVLGIFAGVLATVASAQAGGFISIGLPGLSVQVGGPRVHVQAGPVAVGVGFPVPVVCAQPVVYAPTPVVYAAPPVHVRHGRHVKVRAPRHVMAPPPFVVYQGPYPSHIAPPYCP